MVKWTFLVSAALLAYHYVLYPALVIGGARLARRQSPPPPPQWPTVTFVVAAYNEERVIADKLRNTLDLDYPKDGFEVIVVSDGSNDRTEAVVSSFAPQGVVSLHEPQRRGKTAALNRAVKRAGARRGLALRRRHQRSTGLTRAADGIRSIRLTGRLPPRHAARPHRCRARHRSRRFESQ